VGGHSARILAITGFLGFHDKVSEWVREVLRSCRPFGIPAHLCFNFPSGCDLCALGSCPFAISCVLFVVRLGFSPFFLAVRVHLDLRLYKSGRKPGFDQNDFRLQKINGPEITSRPRSSKDLPFHFPEYYIQQSLPGERRHPFFWILTLTLKAYTQCNSRKEEAPMTVKVANIRQFAQIFSTLSTLPVAAFQRGERAGNTEKIFGKEGEKRRSSGYCLVT